MITNIFNTINSILTFVSNPVVAYTIISVGIAIFVLGMMARFIPTRKAHKHNTASTYVSNKRFVRSVLYTQVRIIKDQNPNKVFGNVTLKSK